MPDPRLAYIGTSTETEEDGVFGYRVGDDGHLIRTSATNGGPNPMFLASNSAGTHLYVANRPTVIGNVVAYEIDQCSGDLRRINHATTAGGGTPCYCSVDATDQCVLTAQPSGGTVSILPLTADGAVHEPTTVLAHTGSGPDPDMQSEPYPHAIIPGPDNDFAYAPDLGADRIYVYDLDPDTPTIRPASCGHVSVSHGAGPRHLEFHPSGKYAYLVTQLDSTVVAFERDAQTGWLEASSTVDALPGSFGGANDAADIHVHPSGNFLYSSNRGHDSIARFSLDDSGRPSFIETVSSGGQCPRYFTVHPNGRFLYAANADSDTIVTFRIAEDGTLTKTGSITSVPSPVCMQFVGV